MKKLRKWIKKHFELYDIDDLITGGHCGCCGAWIKYEIVHKHWPYSVCQKCLDDGKKFEKEK